MGLKALGVVGMDMAEKVGERRRPVRCNEVVD
jgi:hypothetical protein